MHEHGLDRLPVYVEVLLAEVGVVLKALDGSLGREVPKLEALGL